MDIKECVFLMLLSSVFCGNTPHCEILPHSSCFTNQMKIFLDSAAMFIENARGLAKDFVVKERNDVDQPCRSYPMDCEEISYSGHKVSGVYAIWPRSRIITGSVDVYCDMTTDGGGWTVFQRRGDFGRSNDYFYNGWNTYKVGFGNINQDFWLGNDLLFSISNQRLYSLRVDMKDLENHARHAVYDNFWIDSEDYNYTLHVKGYKGDAGDSLSLHSGQQFSTKDRDNDIDEQRHCAETFKGAWWYKKCLSSNLNGLYLNGTHSTLADGIEWSAWKAYNYSLPLVEMKIRSFTFYTRRDKEQNATPFE